MALWSEILSRITFKKENKSEAAIIWQFFSQEKGENPHRYKQYIFNLEIDKSTFINANHFLYFHKYLSDMNY